MKDEGAFLAKQASDAQAAIKQTLGEMGSALSEVVDVRTWTKQYPWISVGTAAVVGLTAALALTPKRRAKVDAATMEEAKEKWQEVWEKIASKIGEPVDVSVVDEPVAKEKKAGGGLMGMIMGPLLSIAKTAIASGIASMTAPKPTNGEQPAETYS